MDPNTRALIMGAAGAGGAAAATYVEDVFSTWLYTGNGGTQTITNGIDLSGKGGLVWIKTRSDGYNNVLYDTVRGTGTGKALYSNTTGAEGSDTSIQNLTAFNSDGFSLGTTSSTNILNDSGNTRVSWTFRKAAKFFDVVTYTGNGSNRTIAHNLGSVPGCIIVKRTDTTGDWQVYHRANTANPETDYLVLNSTAATADSDTRWNDTLPTSSVFSLGTDATVNANTATYVAYLFAHDAGGFGDSGNDSVVKCGSYTGNGSATGPTVTLGWEPQWLLIKRTDATADWQLIDNMRGFVVGGTDAELNPNLSNAESTGTFVTPLATGFQLNTTLGSYNDFNGTYIYIAIRRGPMKTPTDATKVFSATTRTGIGTFTTGFPVDFNLGIRNDGAANQTASRLTGNNASLSTNSTVAEQYLGGAWAFDSNTQFKNDGVGANSIHWTFRRAPGFFDAVAYTGTGANQQVTHNLGVAPELILIKARSINGGDWAGYSAALGNTKSIALNWDGASATTSFWNNTSPTSSVFTVSTVSGNVNQSGETYIAYLFATCPGVSKVGSYTGTGTTLSIDCGFTAGARFVLIKRTDSTGDWYVWDTARGIVSGDDPYLLLNTQAAEVTNTDYIDPLSTGFQLSSTAPAAINANGGSFIFLAVA